MPTPDLSRLRAAAFVLAIVPLASCRVGDARVPDAPEDAQTPEAMSGPPSGTGSYDDLLALHAEFRGLERFETVDGVTDYGDAAVDRARGRITDFQSRLQDMAVASWPLSRQVDYLVVRGMVDQAHFELEVFRPWERDPGFYVDPLLRTAFVELPAEGADRERLEARLARVTPTLAAARATLDAAAADYADLAIYNLENGDGVGHGHPYRAEPPAGVIGWYDDLLGRARTEQPDLIPAISEARDAIVDFRDWLVEQRPTMTAPAGVGREAFDWYLRQVKLMPYSVDELLVMGEGAYERLTARLVLERHRNRALPELELPADAAEYQRRIDEADRHIRGFLDDHDIITVPASVGRLGTNVPWIERPQGPNFWEQIQYRDPRPDHVHAVIPGHRFDGAMARAVDHPIRSGYSDGGRVEGWGTYLEEALMDAGLLDDFPRTRELFVIFGMKRAVRVHADIMMQLNELTVPEAVTYMVERVPWLDEDVARVDAEIYLRRPPGYGLSYMIGKLQIDALLADRSRQQEDAFDLRAFHDEFMALGRLPVALLRWEMTGLDDEIRELWEWTPVR
ncbi:MAG: DUF885 family protein [Gemmatimonadetes bacterium]|nr:DUF885 family protein [Gemmatimonadota bacterium]NNK63376.1 DUF885 family protein [Gemmatimonadota bacterium]